MQVSVSCATMKMNYAWNKSGSMVMTRHVRCPARYEVCQRCSLISNYQCIYNFTRLRRIDANAPRYQLSFPFFVAWPWYVFVSSGVIRVSGKSIGIYTINTCTVSVWPSGRHNTEAYFSSLMQCFCFSFQCEMAKGTQVKNMSFL